MQAAALDLFRGGRVDVAALRRQEPLPETADELCDVAGALAASPVSVFLGARATESTLKSLSAAGTLKTWRVLHFATHGLVAGETKSFSVNRAEPALLLTPPATGILPYGQPIITAPGLPAGFAVKLQAIVLDLAAPSRVSLTNALRAHVSACECELH